MCVCVCVFFLGGGGVGFLNGRWLLLFGLALFFFFWGGEPRSFFVFFALQQLKALGSQPR